MNARSTILFAAIGAGCIIPDRNITFEGGPDNLFAVRILERTPLPIEMQEICNADPDTMPGVVDLTFCPPVRRSLPGGLVTSADGGPFCDCSGGEDARAIDAFTIYAEDADLDGDSPRDTVFGVFILDPDPRAEAPVPAFLDYWPNGQAGTPIPVREVEADEVDPIGGRTAPGTARDNAPQWEFRIDNGDGGVVDFCNGDDAVDPGVHNLQFLVTDRPWFEAPHFDPDPDDDDAVGSVQKIGVPDLANGASYATVNYVFECVDALDSDDPRSRQCECSQGS